MEPSSGERNGWSDRLRKLWTGSNRLRLMLTLELAVMLPAAALIYLNFYQLKSLKRDKVLEAAIHSDFHQMLAIAEKQINQKAYTLTEGIRDRSPHRMLKRETNYTSSIGSCQSIPSWRTCSSTRPTEDSSFVRSRSE